MPAIALPELLGVVLGQLNVRIRRVLAALDEASKRLQAELARGGHAWWGGGRQGPYHHVHPARCPVRTAPLA